MYKLVIMIETPEDQMAFDDLWPNFLRVAETMPGLLRETSSRVDAVLYGSTQYFLIYELFFESLQVAKDAMTSLEGRNAGKILQSITGGRMVLLLADHKQDDIENILSYRKISQQEDKTT